MYVMSYFRSEAEALHLAISEDGLIWQALNNNLPILSGARGSSLRDPCVMQAQDGLFHLFATSGWEATSIVHAVSDDLLHWSEQELLPVMAHVPNARNAWAPECFYDREAALYRVFWSSSTTEPGNEHDWDHRIWASSTPDFVTWTPAQLFFDPGYSVIDATVAYADGWYWMAFKEERGQNRLGTEGKAIRICSSRQGSGPFTEISEPVTPPLTEGPSLLRLTDRWIMYYDHFYEGFLGASVSEDGRHWTNITAQTRFPEGPRHASALEVGEDAARALRRKS